ncbi:MAG: TetR/AcrR family transcriptional regulator [Imperialibacter sp.]|uniref:TetR/AcrR family transcriptional regulator n=1 Tax=Imperialibacter sp. TaxID=2038411 RepID=UPI0030DB7138
MEVRDNIIEQADQLICRLGVRSVTMDDLSRHMGISKKTIYQFFKDKDEVVTLAVGHHCEKEYREFVKMHQESSNSIDELFKISQFMRTNVETIHPSVLHDIQKYHPKAWTLFEEYKERVFTQNIVDCLKRGKAEGSFRDDIDENILAVLRMKQVEMAFDAHTYPRGRFEFKEVCEQIFYHFIQGILTDQGRKLYDTIFNKQSYESQK